MKELFSNFRSFMVGTNLSDVTTGGMIELYHFTWSKKVANVDSFIMDPKYFVTNRNYYSQNDWQTSRYPRSFFYTNPENKEPIVNGNLFKAEIPETEIYDLKNDPENYVEKHSHPTYGLRKDMEWTEMLRDIHSSYKGAFYSLSNADVIVLFDPTEVNRVE